MNNLTHQPYPGILRALIKVAFIIFLFYSNLLMLGYNSSGNGWHKNLFWIASDVLTKENFLIACIAAVIGYFTFEFLRKKV